MSYKVKLNMFEGPLDLLLFLIKKDKIDISDIPISKVTEQYLHYMEIMKMLDLDIAGEFLVMAATLMHIKSKMLLPPDETDLEEEEQEDPREELVRRLLEYKKYKDAAGQLLEMRDKAKDIFIRKSPANKEIVYKDEKGEYFESSLFELITAFRKVLKEVPKETFHEVIRNRYTVSDKIHSIYHQLAQEPKIYFSSLFKKAGCKDEVIVIFLAILELIKLREVIIVQKEFFSDIEIIRNQEIVKQDTEGASKSDS